MPRGSPDHTDRTELQYMHYTDRVLYEGLVARPVLPVWDTVLNANIEGVFGRIRVGSTDPRLYLRIQIDGVYVFNMNADNLFSIGDWGNNGGFNKFTCTRYDDINNHYDFVYDEEWGLWIKNNITVQLGFAFGGAGNGSFHLFYKEKEG